MRRMVVMMSTQTEKALADLRAAQEMHMDGTFHFAQEAVSYREISAIFGG